MYSVVNHVTKKHNQSVAAFTFVKHGVGPGANRMCAVSRPPLTMAGIRLKFRLRDKDLKKYPHFDKPLSKDKLLKIVTDPDRVKSNAFFPFIQYEKQYRPYRKKPHKPDVKQRLIRYASRRDAAIFTYYRFLLSQRYEERLNELNISEVPIAYRKILKYGKTGGGKCNIDFAGDLFDEVLRQGDCVVVTLDISKYFECIDHRLLYQVWCDLMKVKRLPADHLSVFKAITKYSWADRDEVYERLGFISAVIGRDGSVRKGYMVPFKKMPKQLCSPTEFREKILGKGTGFTKLIKQNDVNLYGIPQGAPISDLLANAYLLKFDQVVADYVRSRNGKYWRYSDDIVLVLPGDEKAGHKAMNFVTKEIRNYGDELKIKPEKTSMVVFNITAGNGLDFRHISGDQGRNGLEYLGFRFDGKRVYLRDSTVSNFYRKITRRARRHARNLVARYPGKSQDWIKMNFNQHQFEERFGRVRDFESINSKKGWTFWTYAKRASERFGFRGESIFRQIKNYRRYIKRTVNSELEKQFKKTGS